MGSEFLLVASGGDRPTTRQRDQRESQANPFFQPGTSLKKALGFLFCLLDVFLTNIPD